jgi:DNA-binding MarR family transcriptional regulator
MQNRIARLTDFLPYLMSVTANEVSGFIAEEYREKFGLRIPEWRIIIVLGHLGALTQRELVDATLMDKVAVNRACKVLEDRDIIARSPNDRDGRSHHLDLTAHGLDVHTEVMPLTSETFERIYAAITPDEREMLKSLLTRIREGVRHLGRDGTA